jgi:hypothetical protein
MAKAAPLPAAWSVEELGACFVARVPSGQQLAYGYFEDDDRPPSCSVRMKREGSQRIKLPEFLRKT